MKHAAIFLSMVVLIIGVAASHAAAPETGWSPHYTHLEPFFGRHLAHDRPLVCYCCCSVPGGQRCVDKTVAECLGRGCRCYGQYK
ncbi:MAG: hypothetical protein V2B18_03370 [Pseudomonadota bacterium]